MEAQFRNVPDGLWEQIAPLIPVRRKNTLRGRPPVPDREVLAGINAWHNRFRGLLVRWERIGAHHLGLLHLACALIAFRQAL